MPETVGGEILNRWAAPSDDGTYVRYKVWTDTAQIREEDIPGALWFSTAMGQAQTRWGISQKTLRVKGTIEGAHGHEPGNVGKLNVFYDDEGVQLYRLETNPNA